MRNASSKYHFMMKYDDHKSTGLMFNNYTKCILSVLGDLMT
jgi:hypothetical protein